MRLPVVFCLWLLLGACSHGQRVQAEEYREPAQTESFGVSEERQAELTEMVQGKDRVALQSLFPSARLAQALVSTFDLRLQKIQDDQALDKLLRSRLYCKLMDAKGSFEVDRRKLAFALRVANGLGSEYERWFYGELSSFARKDIAAEVATAHLIRHFSNHAPSLCGRKDCVSVLAGRILGIPLFHDKAFAAYVEKNLSRLARLSRSGTSDLRPGPCAGSPRGPSSAGYDWRNRNWIKSNLNSGEFVVTYDDGPDEILTPQMMALWDATTYPKPAFFVVWENATLFPTVVQDAAKAGYPMGSHSDRHADLGNLARSTSAKQLNNVNKDIFEPELKDLPPARYSAWREATLEREIITASQAIADLVRATDPAFRMRRFRLPFGSGVGNVAIGARFQAGDYDHFFWQVDSLDWQDTNPISIHRRVTNEMKAGDRGIILFHDIHPQTYEASRLLLETFRTTGNWKPVSITQMVQ